MSELKLIDKIRYKIENIIVNMYLKYMQLRGYILKDRTPIKCPRCKSKDLEDYNYYYLDIYVCEHDRKCKKCDKVLGHWNYGHWDLW